MLQVLLPQRVRHAALVEDRVDLAQVIVVKLFAAREVLPKFELFSSNEAKVGDFPLVERGLGSSGRRTAELCLLPRDEPVVGLEVEPSLPHELLGEVVEGADELLLHL